MKKTFGEIKLAFSVNGDMEDASNMVNDLNIDFHKLQKVLKLMNIDVEIHDIEVTYDED